MNSFDYLDRGADRTERDASGDEVFSVPVKAGKRIYYFDVKATRADDYFVTITESRKRLNRDGSTTIDKHKIHLYKEDFEKFAAGLEEVFNYIRTNKPEAMAAVAAAASSGASSYNGGESKFDADFGITGGEVRGNSLRDNDGLTPRVPTEEEFFGNL